MKGCVSLSEKKYYYTSGHTAEGLKDFSESNLKNIDNVFTLKHPSETLKTAIIKRIVDHFESTCDIEIIESVYGKEYLDGAIVRDKSLAVISQSTEVDNISEADLKNNTDFDEFNKLSTKKSFFENEAYESFATGLKVHDELEKIYIDEMDFAKADQVADTYIKKIIGLSSGTEEKGIIYHRLFGTNTKDGVVNVVPGLVASVSKAYYIKGRAGTGKSTFMKKITQACIENGFEIELYHCSFDPNSIDMLLVKELDFCMFDATDPHEFFPDREGDEIIDLYEKLVTPGTDEKFADDIDNINKKYKSYMKKGIEYLQQAGIYHSQLEENFKSANQNDINETTNYILGQIK